jgi:2-oxoglutarate dehydrogenase E2 component (dihydrolipoamide succinyltransferase)
MAVELKVPTVGESITEVQIGDWLKSEGERVEMNDILVVIETDKATVELPSPVAGTVSRIVKRAGEPASVGEVIGYMDEGDAGGVQRAAGEGAAPEAEAAAAPHRQRGSADSGDAEQQPAERAAPAASEAGDLRILPAARRALAEHGLQPQQVEATGPGGRLLKEDVLRHAESSVPAPGGQSAPEPVRKPAQAPAPEPAQKPAQAPARPPAQAQAQAPAGSRTEESVPMSPMRRRIAERLVEAQQTAALLTTFNEIDMSAVMELRQQQQERFQKEHGVKLGFMSFFVRAAVDALRRVPQLNAQIRDGHIVYHNYHDIGIAVGGGRGLVVPVLRNAELMGFAEIELAIADFARRAQENRLKLEELQGGTFTISNGGIYGSLMSTPIVNPPQTGILGLHAIQKRPVVVDEQVVVRPMMYVAMTYDHRIIDGRESVTFLKRIKECVEAPARMLLEV